MDKFKERVKYWKTCGWAYVPATSGSKRSMWIAHTGQQRAEWGFGCRVCRAALKEMRVVPPKIRPYARLRATSVRTQILKQHANSQFHKAAALRKFANAAAPSPEEFEKVLNLVTEHGGTSGPQGISDIGGGKKVNNMVLALAEAMYEQDRKHVGRAMTITILRDVRKCICAIPQDVVNFNFP